MLQTNEYANFTSIKHSEGRTMAKNFFLKYKVWLVDGILED